LKSSNLKKRGTNQLPLENAHGRHCSSSKYQSPSQVIELDYCNTQQHKLLNDTSLQFLKLKQQKNHHYWKWTFYTAHQTRKPS